MTSTLTLGITAPLHIASLLALTQALSSKYNYLDVSAYHTYTMGLKSSLISYPYTKFNKNKHKLTSPIKFFDPQVAIGHCRNNKSENYNNNKQTKTKKQKQANKLSP
jgi:hypothetical protein